MINIERNWLLIDKKYKDIYSVYDFLYRKSKNGENFKTLYDITFSKNNILLAIENLRTMKKSSYKTENVNNDYFSKLSDLEKVKFIRNLVQNYNPLDYKVIQSQNRDFDRRTIGIPHEQDKLIQQCIKQVLNPICEAQFYNDSYGGRDNRNPHHAIARSYHLIQRGDLHFAIEFHLQDVFRNINHGRLLKQIYNLGIRDKTFIKMISIILKNQKDNGIVQSGLLFTLLLNIYLNDLDWWVDSQFRGFPTEKNYSCLLSHNRALKNTKLKEFYIIRYEDSFRILCRDYYTAKKVATSTELWLKERLYLNLREKPRIINLKKGYMNFLGLKIKVHRKGIKHYSNNQKKKYTIKSMISNEMEQLIIKKIRGRLKRIQHSKTPQKEISQYNKMIINYHYYYGSASHVSHSFHHIEYKTMKCLKNRLNPTYEIGRKNSTINKYYSNSKAIKYAFNEALVPIGYVQTKPPMQLKQEVSNYTKEGRDIANMYNELYFNSKIGQSLLSKGDKEYISNRIDLYIKSKQLCSISHLRLNRHTFQCHHKIPKYLGGSDEKDNLIILHPKIHLLIHCTRENKIKELLLELELNAEQLEEINKLRKLCNLQEI